MAYTEILRSLLNDVRSSGPVIVDKPKLLFLLGWGQDRGGAWTDLVSHWEAINEDPQTLFGLETWNKIVLAKTSAAEAPKMVCIQSEWAEQPIKRRRI